MAAIGDYVHLTAAGYNKTGILRQNRKMQSISVNQALVAQRKSVIDRINAYQNVSDEAILSLENRINQLLDILGTDDGQSNNNWGEQARKYLEKMMTEEFSQLQNIDWSSGSISANSTLKGIGSIRENYTSYKNWRQTLISRVNELNAYLREMEALTAAETGVDPNKYTEALMKVNTLLTDTYQKTWEKVNNMGMAVNKGTMKNMIKQLNEIIGAYAAMPAAQLQNGTFFERLLQLIPEMGNNLAEKEVDEAVRSYSKGQSTVKVQIDEKFFKDKSLSIDLGDITQTIRTSQNKIDVSFDWEDQPLNISAKNLDIGKGVKFIHTTQGYSLLYLLQDEDSSFVNHYLNLFAQHDDKAGKSLKDARNEVLQCLKLTLAYKGLTGDTYGRGNAMTNVFVVNNYTGGKNHVKVISVANLLNKFANNDSRFLSLKSAPEDVSKLYKNKKVKDNKDGTVRIANILRQMHARKVTTSFSSALLK